MQEFGFTVPALIDEANRILAGHGRLEAAKLLGLTSIPCVRVSHMSEAQKRAYIIADNKLALNAGWDDDLLAEELQALMGLDPGFDLTVTGFSIPEIDHVIANHRPEEPGSPQDNLLPDPAMIPRRCRPGDIYRAGPHKVICGDARDHAIVAALMDGERSSMVITDPHGLASPRRCQRGRLRGLQRAQEPECLVKDNGGMGTLYRSRHELVFVYKSGAEPHINNFELGQHGRYRTNVWEYAGVNTLKARRLEELAMHPTVKPVQMLADAIKDVSGRSDIVLDLFGGSGSTLIAAHKTGRRGYLCEYDALYCDKILARFEAFAHEDAELIACGLPSPIKTEGGDQ